MSNQLPEPNSGSFSIQGEIKKRKTQEIQRAIVARQVAQAQGSSPAKRDLEEHVASAVPASREPDIRRTTQTVKPVTAVQPTPTEIPKRPFANSRRLGIVIVLTCIIAVITGIFLLTATGPSSVAAMPTMVPLPLSTANDLTVYLMKSGLPVTNLRRLTVDKSSWLAGEEIQLDVQHEGKKATVLVLSYTSPDRAISDDFRVRASNKFKDWQIQTIANILLLVSPDSAPDFKQQIVSYSRSYLLVPYRPFLSTATTTK